MQYKIMSVNQCQLIPANRIIQCWRVVFELTNDVSEIALQKIFAELCVCLSSLVQQKKVLKVLRQPIIIHSRSRVHKSRKFAVIEIVYG